MLFKRKFFVFKNIEHKRMIKIFLPISIVFFIFLFALALLFSSSFTKVGTKIIIKNYNSSLSMISKYYQQMRFNTVPIASTLLDDENIQNYIFARKDKPEAMIGAYYTLENVVARNNYLNSIYIYNDTYGFFSNIKGDEGFDNLNDPTLLDFINTHPNNNTLYQRNVHSSNGASKNYLFSGDDTQLVNLFTICNNSYDKNGKLKYGIIVNLDESKARELFFSDMDGSFANFYMFKTDGNFLSHPNPEDYGKSIKDFPLFKQINDLHKNSGDLILKDSDGNSYLACWITQTEMNWKLVYLLPMDQILTPIRTLRNRLLLIFVIILILSYISIYVASKKMEKSLSRKGRLISYLNGNIDNSSFVIYSPQTLFSVASIKIILNKEQMLNEDKMYLSIKAYEYVANYLKSNKLDGFILNIEPNIYLYLIPKSIKNLQSYLQKLQIDIKDDLKIEIDSIYIDGQISFEELPDISKALISALKNVSLEKKEFVLPYKELESPSISGVGLFQTSDLEKALMVKNSKAYHIEVNKMIDNLKLQQDWELFKSLKVYLYYAFESTCTKYLNVKSIGFLAEWRTQILGATTYDELKIALLEIDILIEKANDNESIRHQTELIGTIKGFIDNNIRDVNLSSALIADELKLSLGYVRAQYKSIEGESINDYIGRNRLSLACSQLIETSKSVNEIREVVGFSNYCYFCTYFKKMKGCSPSNYRKQIMEKNMLNDDKELI
ncbi:MAG: AraC family transcriptional regulator [Spirochaetaceae bacterium]|nr:AraC family transcriptional regulator [Spirochaetaceae bacterium]